MIFNAILYVVLVGVALLLICCSVFLFRADQRAVKNKKRREKKWYQRSQFLIAMGISIMTVTIFVRVVVFNLFLASSLIIDIILIFIAIVNVLIVGYAVYLAKETQ
ncbi:hypothetical protein [Tengunoibacter tsumagoiensis]|uniref:Uncharacterized protein n=1 Tax=Tengunoibacter tsumagoiensis TaxID=2014871 RepID=A0A401ZZA3_9CHLR|nr:hypothetical protein [Tengunoibacter tsumagoiensis]GCE12161.1 hypothetical protein KTT_20200 [Tengunoibacter tsumagoiensis]